MDNEKKKYQGGQESLIGLQQENSKAHDKTNTTTIQNQTQDIQTYTTD
jgi:hypothetical protein